MAPPEHPTNRTPAAADPQPWRGLEEWLASPELPELLERVFPNSRDEWADPVTRRRFLKLAGASVALAGAAAAGCSPRAAPLEKIYPYVTQPPQIVQGVPLYFATAMPLCGVATPLLVKSLEGRPIKAEGNPSHPASEGATDLFAQASLLNLYDPDRSRAVSFRGDPRSWDDAIRTIRDRLQQLRERGAQGPGVRVLTETVTSPALAAQITAFVGGLPNARWYQYDAAGPHAAREGGRLAFGEYVNTAYDLTQADVIVSLDADFLSCGPASVKMTRDYSSRRRVRTTAPDGIPVEKMNRLYVVESMLTSTGSVADHRLPIKSGLVDTFARTLARRLGVPNVPDPAGPLPPEAQAWIEPLAKDLTGSRGPGTTVVIPGNQQSPTVHAIAHAINDHLKNTGKTVFYTAPLEARPTNQIEDLKTLLNEIRAKQVEVLLIVGCNPVYSTPTDLDFAAALGSFPKNPKETRNVPFVVHVGTHADETAAFADWHLPETHYLEAWGDARAYDGTVTILQPLIAPLFNGRSALELFYTLGERTDESKPFTFTAAPVEQGRELVTAFWRAEWEKRGKSGDFESWWQESIRKGLLLLDAVSPLPRLTKPYRGEWARQAPATPAPATIELVLRPDPALLDGRFANNGWLQELPKPVTKMTWDNAAYLSPATAARLQIPDVHVPMSGGGEHGRGWVPVVDLKYRGRTLRLPVWVLPGHADESITVHLGYGRTRAGNVGTPDGQPVGKNAYLLQFSDTTSVLSGVEVTKTDETYTLACSQIGHAKQVMEDVRARKPARRQTTAEFKANPTWAQVPPAAAGEARPINELVPGPNELLPRKAGEWGHHEHTEESEKKEKHDSRLKPLTLYPPTSKGEGSPRIETMKDNYRWGMVIDLSSCVDCSACVVACQAENNIAVVGKDQVTRGREMHWLRIDRYFEPVDANVKDYDPAQPARPDALHIHFQPVACVHCEKAPCELVCPVNATVHSADGLNDMVYNRCVGTRYCSNNCPYKVRRFNFLAYSDFDTPSLKLGRNPEVTVRSRGVMEKCTYCVQRIRAAEIDAQRERRPIKDGEVRTACQSVCPAGAITFGDISDEHSNDKKGSLVRALKREPHNYGLLAELNTMPRTTYLAAIRNPNTDMPTGRKA